MDILMEQWKNEYMKEDTTYKVQIDNFITFLMLPQVNLANSPAKIGTPDLNAFIAYYVENGTIKYANTLKSYLESVKSFYKFLILKGYVSIQIIPVEKYSLYISEQIEKYHLKSASSREWLDNNTIKSILEKLDSYFDNTNYDLLSGSQESKRYVDRIALRIYLKICLIAPAKKSYLYDLTFSSFSGNYRTLTIYNIDINVPYGLRCNLKHMLDFISLHTGFVPKSNEKIFSFINKSIDVKDTAERINYSFASFLKDYDIIPLPASCLSYSVEIIANTTIFNLVISGANPCYISQITGISIGSLEKKYYSSLNENDFITYYSVDESLNRYIANCNYYHYL